MQLNGPIGVFDSGYGGLTVLKDIVSALPQYDYLYLGDNARAPYGSRSFETIYRYTLDSVRWFFQQGCPLVILACNTASAKALRTIQQNDLGKLAPGRRVLGVIRPTTEKVGMLTQTRTVGILGTRGTVESGSYVIEIAKFFPDIRVYQQACPMWVPLIENGEYDNEGAVYFMRKYLDELFAKASDIDTLLLACTHYPLIQQQLQRMLPAHIKLVSQGPIVAESLVDYLQRHPEIEQQCTRNQTVRFYTTDSPADFDRQASSFYGKSTTAVQIELPAT